MSDLIESYNADGLRLKEQIMEICLHMGGGIEYNTAWGMSYEDREIAIRAINKKFKDLNPNATEYM